jgi:hypothetical protein
MVQRVIVFIFVVVFGVATACGETYHSSYSVACSNIWPAVRATLADQDHYAKVIINDEKMKADYQPKHTVHVDISGTLLQRMNHVTLKPKGDGCEMDVVSNYSGWGHDDQSDFKKRVDDTLTKPAGAPAAEPAKPAATAEAAKPNE